MSATTGQRSGVTAVIGGFIDGLDRFLGVIGLGAVIPILKCAGRTLLVIFNPMLAFFGLIFLLSVWGMHLFRGHLRAVCVKELTENLTDDKPMHYYTREENWFVNQDGSYEICGQGHQCPEKYMCVSNIGYNPDNGFTSFDNLFYSALVTLTVGLNDYWEATFIKIVFVKGYFYTFFFLVVIVLSYVFHYTILAAVFSVFNRQWEEEQRKKNSKLVDKSKSVTAKDDIPFIDEEEQNGDAAKSSSQAAPTTDRSQRTNCQSCLDVCCGCECCSCCDRVRDFCRAVIFNPFVQQFIVICLLVDVGNMALDHHNMTVEFSHGMRNFSYITTVIYLLEFVFKVIALGFRGYFTVSWNWLEFVIVLFQVLSLVFETVMYLSVLRIYSLFKVFRVGRFWPSYHHVIRMMGKAHRVVIGFVFIMTISLLILAAIGTRVFGEEYAAKSEKNFEDSPPRWHVMDLNHSFLVVFRSIAGEWVESMWDAMLVCGFPTIFFFLFTVLFGNMIMLNLCTVFQVAYIAKVNDAEEIDRRSLIHVMSDTADQLIRAWKAMTSRICSRQIGYEREMNESSTRIGDANSSTIQIIGDESVVLGMDEPSQQTRGVTRRTSVDVAEDCFPVTSCGGRCPKLCGDADCWKTLRSKCLSLVTNEIFDWVVISLIIVDIALIAADIESDHDEWLRVLVRDVFPIIFMLEMIIRLIGRGFTDYFSSGFRCWDFILVLFYFVNEVLINDFLGYVVVFRIFRLLRKTWRFEAARAVTNTIFEAFPGLVNVLMHTIFVWLFFAILGVQMLAGKFYRCVDPGSGERHNASYIPDKTDCLQRNSSWENSDIHFDNVVEAFLALSQLATMKGWIGIMHNAMDSKHVDDQPDTEVNFYLVYYLMFFILFGSYFSYVQWYSVLIDAFNRQRHRTNEERNVKSHEEDIYYKAVRIMSSRGPNQTGQTAQNGLGRLVNSLPFDVLVFIMILLNIIFLSLNHHNESDTFEEVMTMIYVAFLVFYVVEVGLRAVTQQRSFANHWINILDCVAVVLIIITLSTGDVVSLYVLPPAFLRLPRAFEIVSKYKWLKRFPGLRRVLVAAKKTVPYLCFLVLLEGLIILCYAVSGLVLWRDVKQHYEPTIYFNNLRDAVVILCQMLTSAGWDGILNTIGNERDCEDHISCGSKVSGVIYLVSYLTVSYLGVVTLLTVIVIQMYSEAGEEELRSLENEQMDHFYKSWSQYDKQGTGYLELSQLTSLLDLQSNAFGYSQTGDLSVASLDIPIVEGERVHHRDVLDALFRWSLREGGMDVKNVEAFDQLAHPEPDYKPISSTLWRKRQEASALKIQRSWSQHKNQKL